MFILLLHRERAVGAKLAFLRIDISLKKYSHRKLSISTRRLVTRARAPPPVFRASLDSSGTHPSGCLRAIFKRRGIRVYPTQRPTSPEKETRGQFRLLVIHTLTNLSEPCTVSKLALRERAASLSLPLSTPISSPPPPRTFPSQHTMQISYVRLDVHGSIRARYFHEFSQLYTLVEFLYGRGCQTSEAS